MPPNNCELVAAHERLRPNVRYARKDSKILIRTCIQYIAYLAGSVFQCSLQARAIFAVGGQPDLY